MLGRELLRSDPGVGVQEQGEHWRSGPGEGVGLLQRQLKISPQK